MQPPTHPGWGEASPRELIGLIHQAARTEQEEIPLAPPTKYRSAGERSWWSLLDAIPEEFSCRVRLPDLAWERSVIFWFVCFGEIKSGA
ncbi:hypothetical protein NPIL_397081 [Nephila pilipes]|uniref:Uncharacterized protein n=1 Tax=Nephila pilipes TaxID=299642 RepID=A0A8X6R4E9_NEPPI|nr:hypothetical protein NPIL_397081 [Nephila pilipes]